MKGFMLCEETKDLRMLDSREYVAEFKFDGVRTGFSNTDRTLLYNRDGVLLNDRIPEVLSALQKIEDKVVLDGELVYGDDFDVVLRRVHSRNRSKIRMFSKTIPLTYMVFDILYFNGDVSKLPFMERKAILKKLCEKLKDKRVCYVKHTGNKKVLWGNVVKSDKEGIILKKVDGSYVVGRSHCCLKLKNFKEAVIRFSEYERSDGGIVLIKDGVRVACNGQQHIKVKSEIDTNGCVDVEVQYLFKTKKGKLRQATFKRAML